MSAAHPRGVLTTPGILVVSDSASLRHLVIGVLRRMGLRVGMEAENLHVARQGLAGNETGMVILDWEMVNGNGRRLLREIRAGNGASRLPVLVMTSGWAESVAEAAADGASGILLKPFSPATLQARVQHLLLRKISRSGGVPLPEPDSIAARGPREQTK